MVIFSVNQADQGEAVNERNHGEAMRLLSADNAIEGLGVYKGVAERSIITSDDVTAVALAKRFNQESYLVQGHLNIWYLVDTKDGTVLDYFTGLREVTKEEAVKEDNYTAVQGKFYVGRKY